MKFLLVLTLILTSCSQTVSTSDTKAPKAALPKVLIIGDSISAGYTPYAKKYLQGKAEVTRIKGNGQYTGTGLKMIDQWLGNTKWDVIHFNWGLWDIYGWRFQNEDRSPSTYEMRLERLVKRLKETNAKLIWATTTPVCPKPEVTMKRKWKQDVIISKATEKQYLDAALRVMKKHNIEVNDLHSLIEPDLKKYAIAPHDVHYKREGKEKLGKQVADAIEKSLR